MLEFESLRYKNFLSTGNNETVIQINTSPTTLILGDNGSGKSTMLDALCFVLFGKPYRKIKKEQLINSINQRDCLVEIEFKTRGDHYKIRRGIKPNFLNILKNGQLLEENAAVKDQQEYLETHILKLSMKSFTQLVILGSASFVPFMQLGAADRRALVEDILEIQVLSEMNELLKGRVSKIKQEIMLVEQQVVSTNEAIRLVEDSIDSMKQQAEQERQRKLDRIAEIEEQVQAITGDIQVKMEEVEAVLAQIVDESSVADKLSDYSERKTKIKTKAQELSREIRFFQDNETCPTCTQTIQTDFRDQTVTDKKSFLAKLKEGFSALEQKESQFLQRKEEISECRVKVQGIRQDIAARRAESNTLNTEARRLSLDIQKTDSALIAKEASKLDDLRRREEELEIIRKHLAETKQLQDIASIMLKDGGIKTSIIRQYLPVINKVVNRFLSALNFPVQFSLDETFNETIRARHRDEFSYPSFSEGEKLRIDLAILFCWREVSRLKNSMATNLLILDEVVDSSLDATGIDAFMTVLTELSENTHVFVISHKSDALAEKFDRTFRFVKRANFSQIQVV